MIGRHQQRITAVASQKGYEIRELEKVQGAHECARNARVSRAFRTRESSCPSVVFGEFRLCVCLYFFFSLEASNYSRCHREGRSGRNLVADTASPVVAELINSVFCEQFVPLSYKEEQLGGNKVKVTRFRACYGDFP